LKYLQSRIKAGLPGLADWRIRYVEGAELLGLADFAKGTELSGLTDIKSVNPRNPAPNSTFRRSI